jgi:Kdo2-lipid IVA lauroyltransferase/acyltransferase
MRYRIKHVIEYGALRTLVALVSVLPYRGALFVGWIVAWISFFLLPFRRKEAESRIRRVFLYALHGSQVRAIAWKAWRNIVFNGIEMVRAGKVTPAWIRKVFVDLDCLKVLKTHCDTGRGAIFACPHMGSWELAAIGAHFNGIPIFSFAAVQKNPLVDRYMNKMRTKHGVESIARGSSGLREILRKLKTGHILAILPDVRMRTPALSIPFLGGTANIGEGMALFAKIADVPIFPCIVTRVGWAGHHTQVHPPVWPDKELGRDEDILRMTTAVMGIIENAIRNDPAQWFWFNKRWILDPIDNKTPQKQMSN